MFYLEIGVRPKDKYLAATTGLGAMNLNPRMVTVSPLFDVHTPLGGQAIYTILTFTFSTIISTASTAVTAIIVTCCVIINVS